MPAKLKPAKRIIPQDVIEIGHGLGAADSSKGSCSKIVSMFKDKICAPTPAPIYFTSSRRYGGPLTPSQLSEGLGNSIDLFDPDPPGALEVYQTPGMKNGQFQQSLLIMGIGIHGFAPQHSYSLRGNAFIASAFASSTAPSFSPSEYTLKDATATTGAWGTSQIPAAPAVLDAGDWINLGMHYFALGNNLRWTFGNQVNLLDDVLRHTLHMPQNPMDGSAGLSQQATFLAVSGCNSYYVGTLGSTLVFIAADSIRVGCQGTGATGLFAASNDYQLVDQLWGGGTVRNLRANPELRLLDNPQILPRGIDCGIRIESNSEVLQTAFQTEWGANNGSTSAVIPQAIVGYANFAGTGTSAYTERTVDGFNVTQQNPSSRYLFKVGEWQLDAVIHAWEIAPVVLQHIEGNPDTASMLAVECGIRCG